MMLEMTIRPLPGRTIRMPDGVRILPEEGAKVPKSRYYMRRLLRGDAELVPDTTLPDPERYEEPLENPTE